MRTNLNIFTKESCMAGCEQLANELQRLRKLEQDERNPRVRAEIAEAIAGIQRHQQAQGCFATKQTPWAILLCKFNDDQSETPVPDFRTVCERFFATPGAGFNAVQFFQDMSHGSLDLSGSKVLGWYTLDVAVNDLIPPIDPPPPGWIPKKSQS